MRSAILLALLAAACSSSNGAVDTALPAEVPQDAPEVPRDVLDHDLEATVIENYSHLTLGNFSAFRDGLAQDEQVTLLGVTPADVVVGRRPPEAARDRRLYRVLGPTLLSKNLDVHLSADGSVGWTFDEMSYRVPYQGRTASIPIRNTELYLRDFDRWVLVMQHQSYAVSIDDLRTLAGSGALEEPKRFPSRSFDKESRDLIALVGRLHNGGDRPIAHGDGVLVLLPDRDHELRGADAAQASSLAALFGAGSTVGLRDYRIGVAKDRRVAWMAANLVVRTASGAGGASVDLGLRGTYVFEKAEAGWEVVQMHISAAVPEGELSRRMFGTP